MSALKKFLIFFLLTNLSACNTSTKTSEIPTATTSITLVTATPTPEPTKEPTVTPTEAVSIVHPEGQTSIQYSQEQLDLIHSGKFQEDEKVMAAWLDYWMAGEPETGELDFKSMPLTYIYFFDSTNPDTPVIVGLESPDYPNTAIFPPVDYAKSKGLHVVFLESLPYEKDGHSIPDYLMPTFITIDANEESVASGKMQERFLNTTLANIDGELVRINSEGKIVAKIGVKPETQEAKWVRPLCKDYSNPENYTPITIEEIQNGQILFDEEVQAEPFPEDVEFPARFELMVNQISGSVRGYYANGEPTTKFYRNAFFYMLDETYQGEGKTWYVSIVSQQYLNKDGSWSFVKRARGWSGVNPDDFVKKITPNMAMLPTFYLPKKTFPQSSWEYYHRINNDDTYLSQDGNLKRLYEEYTVTGFIPYELTRYIIPGVSYVKVK